MLRVWAVACLFLVIASCGGGRMSLAEYGEQSEVLTVDVIERLYAADAEWESQPPSLERAQAYWDTRLTARTEFLEGIKGFNPPQDLAEFHQGAVDLVTRLVAAEQAMADQAATYETVTDHWQWWDTPEGQTARALDNEIIAICHVAQAEFDATEDREEFRDTPWVPPELKEVIRVAFSCPELLE